jgi:hypothetical protein
MKKNLLTAAAAVLFLVFLGLGILAGRQLIGASASTSEPAFHEEAAEAPLPHTEEPEDQAAAGLEQAGLEPAGEMVLILFTSRREGTPNLEGVWLLSTDRSENIGHFLPVMPSQAEDGGVRDQILRAAYSLEGGEQPGADFFRVLEERNLSWDGYVMVGEQSAFDLAAASSPEAGFPAGYPAAFRSQSEPADLVRLHQADLLDAACSLLKQGEHPAGVRQTAEELLNQPGLSDTSAAELVWAPADEGSGQTLTCLFPTLEDTSR